MPVDPRAQSQCIQPPIGNVTFAANFPARHVNAICGKTPRTTPLYTVICKVNWFLPGPGRDMVHRNVISPGTRALAHP